MKPTAIPSGHIITSLSQVKILQDDKKLKPNLVSSDLTTLRDVVNKHTGILERLVNWHNSEYDIKKADIPQIPVGETQKEIKPSHLNSDRFSFERKVAYAASAYCITTNLPSILPIAIQEILSFQSQPAQVVTGILFYALINTCMEKLLTQGSLGQLKKLGKQGLTLLQNTLTSILQTLLYSSAKLASIGYSLVKWLIKILTPSVLLSTAVHLAKPEMKLPEMIFNSTQEAISTYQLDTLATIVMENPYTPYGIAFFLVLLSLGTLKNGYDYYSIRNKPEVIIINE